MDNLFLLLFFVSVISLIIGLIKPSVFARFLKGRATRKGVATIFGIATVVFLILFAVTTNTKTQPVENKNEEAVQQNNQEINKGPYSVLEVSDVSVSETKISISGKTDLPNGSSLIVGFDVWGRAGDDLYIGVDGKTTVSNGAFSIDLDVPQRDEFKSGPYEVSVSFTPVGQNDSVIALVGKDGENLEGELVDIAFGSFNTMKLVVKKDLNLSVSPVEYNFVFELPSQYPSGTAEYSLAKFVDSWKKQDWKGMTTWVAKDWISRESNPAGTLAAWSDFKYLEGFKITNISRRSEVLTTITFEVQYRLWSPNSLDVKKVQIRADVRKQNNNGYPDSGGTWGVYPLFSETEVE